MKRRRRRKPQNSSNRNNHLTLISEFKYLPSEIWTQILSKLPAKTLLKLRCVCKSWCSIIDDPDFIHIHHQFSQIPNSGNNTTSLLILGGENGWSGWMLTVLHAETLRKTGLIFRTSDDMYVYHMIGSCNGLILVSRTDDSPSFQRELNELRLWNPCIRKSLVIPACPFSRSLECFYVFGYAPVSKHYKVIAISKKSARKNLGKISWAVYILGDQQWTVRNDVLNISFPNNISLSRPFFGLQANVFVKGVAYWLGSIDKDRNEFTTHVGQFTTHLGSFTTHLGSFDFDNEEIAFLELPSSWNERGSVKFLFLLRESLAIFKISDVDSSIWVLEQDNEKGTWTQRFSGKSSPYGYQLFSYMLSKKVFFCESDGGYFICENTSYNITSCEVRELREYKAYCQLELYSESLVLSKGYGARDLRFFL
ncbi:F-box/kelch-repeat protein At3g23880-like [Silene latifolia]|uniref:F-box/kelch-repeat protein At3g23880-like n=1 Tax=Silene latifolia TaxID=37657 RepID=UPI003D77C4E8